MKKGDRGGFGGKDTIARLNPSCLPFFKVGKSFFPGVVVGATSHFFRVEPGLGRRNPEIESPLFGGSQDPIPYSYSRFRG